MPTIVIALGPLIAKPTPWASIIRRALFAKIVLETIETFAINRLWHRVALNELTLPIGKPNTVCDAFTEIWICADAM